ncbi:MAG: precorrin-4 C(11)-methyltransferase, partial [Pseudomonadota bacterium]
GMKEAVREAKITRTALILVGPVFGEVAFRDSDLYNKNYSHVLRNKGKKKRANA